MCIAFSFTTLAADRLQPGFQNPPPSARPWVYYFALQGNLTKEGITADLEAMQRAGIGGVIIMEVNQGAPDGPVSFAGAEWRGLFKHLCTEAARLGLDVNMNNDAGWCGSGGPWITPALSMQKIVWSETVVQGPLQFDGILNQPETLTNYYRDIALLAVPTLPGETQRMADAAPALRCSATVPTGDLKALWDGDPKTAITLPALSSGKPQFIQMDFTAPYKACTLRLALGNSYRRLFSGEIQVSNDGQTFKTLSTFEVKPPWSTIAFDETSARHYRIVFTSSDRKSEKVAVAEIDLLGRYCIDQIEAKSALATHQIPLETIHRIVPATNTVPERSIIQLTSAMDSNGRLKWAVPAGSWTLLRFGCTTTGKDNYPAPPSGRGLECDKLSKEGAEAAFNGLMGKLISDVGPLAGKTLVSTHIDSWEVGSQNWTPKLREEFLQRRGYQMLPFLPVMTGRVVGSLEMSERFLWDLRTTISELLLDNYAGHFHDLANKNGLRLSIEAYDYNPSDDMSYAGRADEPMAEFWSWGKFGLAWACTEMSSAAHVYGKRILGAEAFTANSDEKWQGHPGNIKDLGDWAFCEGINRFVFHRYALQPWTNAAPGMAMGPWGLHYERTQTWWDQSIAWHTYLSRCQYLLQQGLSVADICWLAPENSPNRWLAPTKRDDAQYNFDGCPPEVVLTRMQVKDGRLVLPDGMSYRVLALTNISAMTPRLLRKIVDLVHTGATIVGSRPEKSPSLADYPSCDAEVKSLADELWGKNAQAIGLRSIGKGTVVWGKSPEQVLTEMNIPRDFVAQGTQSVTPLRYTHRKVGDTDLYFLANKNPRFEQTLCSFRIQGRRPEFWWPDSGRTEYPAVFDESAGCTHVPITFEPNGSVFVVFKRDSNPKPDHITSVTRSGTTLVDTQARPARLADSAETLTNSFTFALWAKPAVDIDLPAETNHGIGTRYKRNDAIYPVPGHECFGQGQCGAGVSIGRNGVCVYEHGDYYFAPVLVFHASITNWTHVAVVYQDCKPTLFLDGRLVHTGLKSRFTVHPSVGVASGRTVTPFSGWLSEAQQYPRTMTPADVEELASSKPKPFAAGRTPGIHVEQRNDAACEALVWEPGVYTFQTASGKHLQAEVRTPQKTMEITGPWTVSFPQPPGPPLDVKFQDLISWSEHPATDIKYFSGKATYTKVFSVPSDIISKSLRTFLDLGQVGVMADVKLNGRELGILWKSPFRLEVTEALKPGKNLLEINVVNLWINRLIGDEQLPEDSERNPNGTLKSWPRWLLDGQSSPTGRKTFTSWRLWKKNDPLVDSGLLGPVMLDTASVIDLRLN